MGIDWAFAWSVVLTGIVVVFLALVLLVLVVVIMGKIAEYIQNKKTKETEVKTVVEEVKETEKTSAVVVEDVDGISEEVVAAITAAITCVMEAEGNDGKSFTVKSIKKVKEARPAWAMAGLVENTRTF